MGTPGQLIAAAIKRRNIGLVIVDSAALACGGEPEKAEIANALFNAINKLKVTTLLIAHETKNTDNKNKAPFGSVFFFNCARNIWNAEKSQEQDDSVIHVGLFHRKSNNDRISSPWSARIYFGDGMVDINAEDTSLWAKELSLKEQILSILTEAKGMVDIDELCQALDKDKNQIKSRLNQLKIKDKIIDNPEKGKWVLKEYQNQDTNFDL